MEITEEELNKKIADAVAEAKKGLLTQDQFNEAISKRIGEVNEKHKKELEENGLYLDCFCEKMLNRGLIED